MRTVTLRFAVSRFCLPVSLDGALHEKQMQRCHKSVLASPCAPVKYPVRGVNTKVDLEDSSGTLRFITNVSCDGMPQVTLELRRVKDK